MKNKAKKLIAFLMMLLMVFVMYQDVLKLL